MHLSVCAELDCWSCQMCVYMNTNNKMGDKAHGKGEWPREDWRWGNLSGKGGISWFLLIPITSQRGRANKETQHPHPHPPPHPHAQQKSAHTQKRYYIIQTSKLYGFL